MDKLIIIGKIIGVHGIKGELKVFPITDDARRFLKLKKCYLSKEDRKDPLERECERARLDKGNVLLKLKDLDDRTDAERYRGLFISVDREDAVKLPKDTYFIEDLKGLNVIDDERGGIGKIKDVYEYGANFIVEVKRPGMKDLLIPYLKTVCYEVDLEAGTFKVRLPEGLWEIYE